MSEIAESTAGPAHHVPVIDRMMEMLFVLESRPGGRRRSGILSKRSACRGQRSIASSTPSGITTLSAGRTKVSIVSVPDCFACRARSATRRASISRRSARPFSDRCHRKPERQQGLDRIRQRNLPVVMQHLRPVPLTVAPGQRMPLHAGAAGKTLLAHLPKDTVDRRLAGDLTRYTPRTITDPRRLRSELARIRRQGWAQDRGEYSPSIHAFAAPILDRYGGHCGGVVFHSHRGAATGHMEKHASPSVAAAKALSNRFQAFSSTRKPSSRHLRTGAEPHWNGSGACGRESRSPSPSFRGEGRQRLSVHVTKLFRQPRRQVGIEQRFALRVQHRYRPRGVSQFTSPSSDRAPSV